MFKFTAEQREIVNVLVAAKMRANSATPYDSRNYQAARAAFLAFVTELVGERIVDRVECSRDAWNFYGNATFADDAEQAIVDAVEDEFGDFIDEQERESAKLVERRTELKSGIVWRSIIDARRESGEMAANANRAEQQSGRARDGAWEGRVVRERDGWRAYAEFWQVTGRVGQPCDGRR